VIVGRDVIVAEGVRVAGATVSNGDIVLVGPSVLITKRLGVCVAEGIKVTVGPGVSEGSRGAGVGV